MTLFHRHHWKETGRTFTPNLFERAQAAGLSNMKTGGYFSQEAKDRDLQGFTTVELTCEKCGDVTARYLLGERCA